MEDEPIAVPFRELHPMGMAGQVLDGLRLIWRAYTLLGAVAVVVVLLWYAITGQPLPR